MKTCSLALGVVLFTLVYNGTALALTEKDVLFHASFNDTLTPEIAQGNPTPVRFGNPKFAKGRNNAKALVIENGKTGVICDLPGNLNPREGTISFWISPVDWSGNDAHIIQDYFSSSGTNQYLKIQHVWNRFLISMMVCKGAGGVISEHAERNKRLIGNIPLGAYAGVEVWNRSMQDALSYFQPGVWFLLTFTWRDGEIRSYMNGEPGGVLASPEIAMTDATIGNRFAIGANYFNTPVVVVSESESKDQALPDMGRPHHTRISDFTILDRYLFPQQVKRLFEEGAVQYAESGAVNPPELFIDFYPSRNEVSCRMVGGEGGKAEVRVYASSGGSPLVTQKCEAKGSVLQARIDVSKAPSGVYTVKGFLLNAANQAVSESNPCSFEKETPKWLHNGIGEEDVVLPLWTPLQVEKTRDPASGGNVVECWGRRYTFNGTLFPTQIASQNKPLLSRPIDLWLVSQGATFHARSATSRMISSSDTRAIQVEEGVLGNCAIECKTTVEYDGLVFLEMTLTPKADVPVESLTWELPLRPEHGILFHAPNWKGGLLPSNGWSDAFSYNSHILWLGDDEVGIQWFSDSDEGWVTHDKNGANRRQIEVVPGSGETVLRVNVVNTPTTLHDPIKLKFGLMATPVKPLPKNWRGMMRAWLRYGRYWWRTPYYQDNDFQADMVCDMSEWYTSFGSAPRPDYMKDADWENYKLNLRKINAARHELGLKSIAYSVIYWCGAHYTSRPSIPTREFRIYGKEWANAPYQLDPNYDLFTACPAAPGFCDWWVDNIVNTIIDKDGLDFDGIYYDGGHAIQSSNLEYDCGYKTADGVVHSTFTVMANRNLMRRIYAGVKARKPYSLIVTHSSDDIEMPQMAYTDAIFQGEEFSQPSFGMVKAGLHFSKCMPMDYARTAGSTSRMGIVPWYMGKLYGSYLDGAQKKNEPLRRELAREFLACLFLNDIHAISGTWDRWASGYKDILKVFDYDFGIKDEDVEFHGYWNNSRFVNWQGGKSYVSLWHKPSGLTLFIVANFNDVSGPIKLKLDPKELKLSSNYTIRDGETGEVYANSIPDVTIPIKNYDFRLIVAEPSLPPGEEFLW